MKNVPKYLILSAALIGIAATYGQPKAGAELRIARLQQSLDELAKVPMPVEQVNPVQQRLLQQLVDEVIFLHRENSVLKEDVERLKLKK